MLYVENLALCLILFNGFEFSLQSCAKRKSFRKYIEPRARNITIKRNIFVQTHSCNHIYNETSFLDCYHMCYVMNACVAMTSVERSCITCDGVEPKENIELLPQEKQPKESYLRHMYLWESYIGNLPLRLAYKNESFYECCLNKEDRPVAYDKYLCIYGDQGVPNEYGTNRCYWILNGQLSFTGGGAACGVDGGHLADIHSGESNTILVEHKLLGIHDTWIGLQNQSGVWSWTSGQPLTWKNWKPGKDLGACARASDENDGWWNDNPCDTAFRVLCVKDMDY